MDKILPAGVEWIFTILLVEILVIVLSVIVDHVDPIVLYVSLAIILISMVMIGFLGAKINVDHLPIFVLIVFSANVLLIILILVLIFIAKFLKKFYTITFFVVATCVYPILIMNTLYVSLLIHYDRYEIKKLTDCLKPSLYIYGIFGTYLWFSLNMAIEIGEIL
ncbi:uncharacterized protein LOC124420950 isoform X2 [Lucilia cuprina]|nr:uncharacterized protein LOC124420950 isoform X2 [Lucilia cuprina]XP_046811389.1 uncharacterized protein LOC124420950 isoform X2 [Lucilia cuprina]